jgi:hypothetical protein
MVQSEVRVRRSFDEVAQLAGIAYSFEAVEATLWSDQPEGRKGRRRQ